MTDTVIDMEIFSRARAELGADFVRILGYFREDGVKSVAKIEEAMRNRSAIQLVIPAHTLKGEAAQFGAMPLSLLAEEIETVARRCIERHEAPDELLQAVVRLRPLFNETLTTFDQETNPLMPRRVGGGFGRKAATSFGRA